MLVEVLAGIPQISPTPSLNGTPVSVPCLICCSAFCLMLPTKSAALFCFLACTLPHLLAIIHCHTSTGSQSLGIVASIFFKAQGWMKQGSWSWFPLMCKLDPEPCQVQGLSVQAACDPCGWEPSQQRGLPAMGACLAMGACFFLMQRQPRIGFPPHQQ